MTNPITPPPELVGLIIDESKTCAEMIQRAYTAGADQELEACVEWLDRNSPVIGGFHLRIDRRPKPPSLKRVALLQLDTLNADLGLEGKGVDLSQIRLALEALDD